MLPSGPIPTFVRGKALQDGDALNKLSGLIGSTKIILRLKLTPQKQTLLRLPLLKPAWQPLLVLPIFFASRLSGVANNTL